MTRNTTASGAARAITHAELRQLWSTEEPRRAVGGWWSLSGFSIQATIAFERFVRRSVIEGKTDAFSVEAISDLSEVGAKVRLTQVKRTLTRGTLASAVAEACKIIALCSPALANTLEFQVICECDEAGLTPADLTAHDVFGSEPYALDDLNMVVARFNSHEPVKVVGNPALTLRRTLLEAGVGDPEKAARNVLGTLFDAFDGRDKEGVERALHKALSDIRALVRTEGAAAGRPLTPNLFARRSTDKPALFIGARPRLGELVDGRFMARPERLSPLVTAAEAWLSSLEKSFKADERRLPILWLEGRSGDGKSILTLQLLEAIIAVRGRLASVTELKPEREFSSWLETASPWTTDTPDQAEIGFIDDLGSSLDVADLDTLIDDAFYRGSNYVGLITCGTPERGDVFSYGRHVALTRVPIISPERADFEALRQWAEQRLGRPLPVPVQVGATLSEYVGRLTLVGSNVHCPSAAISRGLRAALAVNALGFPAPGSLVSEADLLAFTRDRPDIDLSPIAEEDGIRLAHSEATWSLYVDGLGGAGLAESWGGDLGRVMAARLDAGDYIAARKILGEMMNTRLPKARLDRSGDCATESVLFDAAYSAFEQACPVEKRAPLFRQWLVAAINGRVTVVTLADLRDRGRQSLASDSIAVDIKSEVAAALLTTGRRMDDAASREAADHMRRAGPDVAAVKFAIGVLSRGFRGQHADLALAWLTRNSTHREAGEVLAKVIDAKAPAKVQAIAFGFVKSFINDPVSGPVLGKLSGFHRTGAFYRIQDQWLRHCSDPLRAAGIYRDQLSASRWYLYVERAMALMQQHPGLRGGQEVLSALLKRQGNDATVLEAARAWLDRHAGEGAATPLLIDLVECQPLHVDDLARALDHIAQGAPGGTLLFATVAVVLGTLDAQQRASLRRALPIRFAYGFDHASNWTPKLEGRLLELRDRLMRRAERA
ncbi:hypothetical protein FS799_10740 [Agrobacterium vitis]|uniref:hypothetical protein n=1 Tax=Agrobacterium vitis TaxID=373 RepID=UPI001F2D076E|nr:hypothetical protein [Agrobacterium vitis]MCE6075330.1 hypothetical protein [Agrobacterium vitis]